MVNNTDLLSKLENIGLNKNQADIYLTLLKQGILSPLEISRMTQINRTTIYRLLEELNKMGLTEEVLDEKRIKARAVNPDKLELLVTQQESKITELKQQIPDLINQLNQVKDTPSTSTKMLYFRGQKGLQQMLWNVLKARKEHVGYGYADWSVGLGNDFAEKLRQEMINRQIYSREIINSKQIMQTHQWTKVKDYDKLYKGRYISKSVVEINHDTYIYNDVFAFCHFFEGELFGVEIHNKEIAKTQRQIFEVLWKMAKKV